MTFSQILSWTKSVDNTGRLPPPVLESDENHDAVFNPVNAILGGHVHQVIQPLEAPIRHQATMGHKKIWWSKSPRPRTQSQSEKTVYKEKNLKPPLRTYNIVNSFPYHMFMHEGGYFRMIR